MSNASNVIHTSRFRESPRQVGTTALLLALAAGPLVWGLHLVVNYAFASEVCYPGLVAPTRPAGIHWLWALLIAIDLAGMAGCAAAAFLAFRNWRAAPRHLPVDREIEVGEGRSRFLAAWGMSTSALFGVAVFFDFVGLWILPLC